MKTIVIMALDRSNQLLVPCSRQSSCRQPAWERWLVLQTKKKKKIAIQQSECRVRTLSVHGRTKVSIKPQADEAWKM